MTISEDGQPAADACVVVADGEPSWRRATCAALVSGGYQALDVPSVDALRWGALRTPPRLFLQEVGPPRSFQQAVVAARSTRASIEGRCPIAVMSAQPFEQLAGVARASNAEGWLDHSADPVEITRGVRRLLSRSHARPVADAWGNHGPTQRRRSGSWALVRLLLIDDSEFALELMQEKLRAAGFDVRIALSLSEMNSILHGWSPNVILVDVNMPEMRGDHLCARLKAKVGADVMVVLCSGMPADELSLVAEAAGADGFVSKSNGLGQFADLVAAWCRQLSDPIVSIQ